MNFEKFFIQVLLYALVYQSRKAEWKKNRYDRVFLILKTSFYISIQPKLFNVQCCYCEVELYVHAFLDVNRLCCQKSAFSLIVVFL